MQKSCLNHQWAACERDSHIPELSIPSIVRSFQQPNSVVSSRVLSWGALVAGARVMNRKVRRQKLYSVTWAKQDRPANTAGGTREHGANLWPTIVLCRNSSQRDWNRILKWSWAARQRNCACSVCPGKPPLSPQIQRIRSESSVCHCAFKISLIHQEQNNKRSCTICILCLFPR